MHKGYRTRDDGSCGKYLHIPGLTFYAEGIAILGNRICYGGVEYTVLPYSCGKCEYRAEIAVRGAEAKRGNTRFDSESARVTREDLLYLVCKKLPL